MPSAAWKRLHTFFRGELSTRQPSGIVAANNTSRINRDCPPTCGRQGPGRCLHTHTHTPPGRGVGSARRGRGTLPTPCPATSPAGPPWQLHRHVSCRRGPRTERRARPLAARLTCQVRGSAPSPSPPLPLRPRARAAGRDARHPPSAPRQRSPRQPAAAPSGRKRIRSNRFQLLQTKPPGHPAGRGRGRWGGAGRDVTPAPSWPIGGRARGAGSRVPGKGIGGRGRPGIPGVPAVSIFRRPRAEAGCLADSRARDLDAFLSRFPKPP